MKTSFCTLDCIKAVMLLFILSVSTALHAQSISGTNSACGLQPANPANLGTGGHKWTAVEPYDAVNNPNITLTASGAGAGQSYLWLASGGVEIVGANDLPTITIQPEPANQGRFFFGDVRVFITNASGAIVNNCNADIVRVFQNWTPTTNIIAGPQCIGPENLPVSGELTYSVPDVIEDAGLYEWDITNAPAFSFVPAGNQPTYSSSITVSVDELQLTADQVIRVKNACGAWQTHIVTVQGAAPALAGGDDYCVSNAVGTSLMLSVANPVAGVDYIWELPGTPSNWTLTGNGTNDASVTVTLNDQQPGIIIVRSSKTTVNGDTCLSIPTLVKINRVPSIAPDISTTVSGCIAFETPNLALDFTVTQTGGNSFVWSGWPTWLQPVGGLVTSNNLTLEVPDWNLVPIEGAEVTVQVNITGQCAQNGSDQVSFSIAPKRPEFINPIVCVDGSSQTYSIPNYPAASYAWTFNGTSLSSSNNSVTFTPIANGTLAVSVTGSTLDACTVSNSIELKVQPSQPATIAGPECIDATGTFSYSIPVVANATSYVWTFAGGSPVTTTMPNFDLVNAGSAGTLSVVALNDGCVSTSSTKALVIRPPAPSQPTVNQCIDLSFAGAATFTTNAVSGATAYQWVIPSGWIATGGTNTGAPAGFQFVTTTNNTLQVTVGAGNTQDVNVQVSAIVGACNSANSTALIVDRSDIFSGADIVNNSVGTSRSFGFTQTGITNFTGYTFAWTAYVSFFGNEQALGNSSTTSSFSFTWSTNNGLIPITRIELTVTDPNGCTITLTRTATDLAINNTIRLAGPAANNVLEPLESGTVKVSPNPASDELRVKVPSAFNGQYEIMLINSQGQMQFKQSYTQSGKQRIDASHLVKGTYFLLIHGNSKRAVERILIK